MRPLSTEPKTQRKQLSTFDERPQVAGRLYSFQTLKQSTISKLDRTRLQFAVATQVFSISATGTYPFLFRRLADLGTKHPVRGRADRLTLRPNPNTGLQQTIQLRAGSHHRIKVSKPSRRPISPATTDQIWSLCSRHFDAN